MKRIEIVSGPESYPVFVGENLFAGLGNSIRNLDSLSAHKLFVVSNTRVFDLYGEPVLDSIAKAGFEIGSCVLPEGEESKNLESIELLLESFGEAGLSRDDAVVSLGGGVIGDIAGFAASIYMRGIAYFQVPTTLLSMVDSSVGGKTGVNTAKGKNLTGSFHNPSAVFVDIEVLGTLDLREVRAGYYELVKHAAIGGGDLFTQTAKFLDKYPLDSFRDFLKANEFRRELADLVHKQILQKARFVENDFREDPSRSDENSRKVLNFGHTIGHALEKATNYSYFRHGEAVGYGILTANEIAKKLEFCDCDSINLLNDVVLRVGKLPAAQTIDIETVCDALTSDKKSIGKSQQWVLLKRIGNPQIFSGNEVPDNVVRESLSSILLSP